MDKEKLEKLAERSALKALSKRRNTDSELIEDDDAYEGDIDSVDIEEVVEFDIFDYCQKDFVEKGDYIDYSIKKNGALAGTKKHPYSWEKLQREYGEGRYQVIAKSKTTGRIVKKQSMEVDGVPEYNKENEKNSFDPSDLVSKIAEVVKPKNEGPSFMELFTLMNSASEKARVEAEKSAEKQTSTLVQMMQQNTQMMLAMLTQQSSQPKQDTTGDLFRLFQSFAEKMENRFEKNLEKIAALNQPKSDIGVLEMLKMKEDAEERGFKKYAQLNQLAEVKAQEKVDLIEEYRGEGGGEKKDKSMTETLIETMLPTIAGALAKTQSQPVAVPQIPQQRRPVSPTRPNQQRTAKPSAPTLPKANFTAQAKPSEKSGQSVRTNNGQSNKPVSQLNSGLPKANFNVSKPVVEVSVTTSESWKKHTTDLLIPVFTEHLLNQTEPHLVAPKIIETLNQNGIGREEFLNKVSNSDILDVVKGFELPEIAYPWFEEVYANIKNSGTNHTIGEHA